jgi:hypothetical protein
LNPCSPITQIGRDYPQITQITQISNPDVKRLILDDRQFDSQPA